MKKLIVAGATDQTLDIFIQASNVTTGAGLTGLVFNSAGLVCYYRKGATGSATALTLATQTVGGAHSDGGFVEIDATNMPGMYRLDLSDTIVNTAGTVTLMLKGATNMAPLTIELQVGATNFEGGVVPTVTTTTTATNLTNLPSIPANWITTAGITDGAYTAAKFAAASLNGKGDWNVGKTGYTLTATTGLGNQTADITGSLSGSVGSVTGAVGSVTGNVGGNVAGSVGSVTGAVGSVTGNVGGNVVGTVAGVTPSTAAQVAALLTTQITEAYRANGAAPTLAQFMCEVLGHLGEASISGTTKTVKQFDHSTSAETFTLDDATNPSSITRAS